MHPSGVRWSRRPTSVLACLCLLLVSAALCPVSPSRVPKAPTSAPDSLPPSPHLPPRNNNNNNHTSSSSSSRHAFLTTVTSYVDSPSGLQVEQREVVSLLEDDDHDEDEHVISTGSPLNSSSAQHGNRRRAKQRADEDPLEDEPLTHSNSNSNININSNNNNNNSNNGGRRQKQGQQRSLNNHNAYHHNHHHSVGGNTNSNTNSNSNNNYNSRNNYHNAYGVSNCSRCRMLEETINVTKEAIKMQILSKLGLKVAPNITKRALPRIPPLDHLLDMYGMQGDSPQQHNTFKPGPVYEEAEDDYHAKMEKIISFAQEPPLTWQLPSNMAIQYFKFSHAVMVNKVVRANLWVYLNPSRTLPDPHIWLHVYKVWRSELNMSHVLQDHAVSAKVAIKPRKGTWFTVDIKKTVGEWFRYPHLNLGLVVQAFDNEGRQLVATDRFPGQDTSLLPFLEVYVMDESKRRTKRMIGLNCEEGSPEVRCCRYPLKVDFEEFGWDWIIAPKSYEANYCSGECPFVFLQKYPHTHLVQQANPSGSAGPCCAPRKMSPISMLYFDHELNIIYGLLPGMVVDRCGCS